MCDYINFYCVWRNVINTVNNWILNFHPVDKANAIADCLENQFTPHDLCDENHERQMEARVQALLEAV
jgi:hypothetical protein